MILLSLSSFTIPRLCVFSSRYFKPTLRLWIKMFNNVGFCYDLHEPPTDMLRHGKHFGWPCCLPYSISRIQSFFFCFQFIYLFIYWLGKATYILFLLAVQVLFLFSNLCMKTYIHCFDISVYHSFLLTKYLNCTSSEITSFINNTFGGEKVFSTSDSKICNVCIGATVLLCAYKTSNNRKKNIF